jgi:hypothetical protein
VLEDQQRERASPGAALDKIRLSAHQYLSATESRRTISLSTIVHRRRTEPPRQGFAARSSSSPSSPPAAQRLSNPCSVTISAAVPAFRTSPPACPGSTHRRRRQTSFRPLPPRLKRRRPPGFPVAAIAVELPACVYDTAMLRYGSEARARGWSAGDGWCGQSFCAAGVTFFRGGDVDHHRRRRTTGRR